MVLWLLFQVKRSMLWFSIVTCLSRFQRWWFALQLQFSSGSNKSHWFLVSSAFFFFLLWGWEWWLWNHKMKWTIDTCNDISEKSKIFIVLSERSQSKMTIYWMIPFVWYSGKIKTVGQKADQWLSGTGSKGNTLVHLGCYNKNAIG